MSYFKKARNYTKSSTTLDEKIAKANREYEKTGVDSVELVEIANSTSGVYYAGIDHPEEPPVQSEVPDSNGFRSRDPSLPAENASDIDPSDPSTWETGGQGMDHLINPNDLPVIHGDNGVETQSTVKDQPILITPDLTGFSGLRVDPNGDPNDMGKYGGIAYTYNLGIWGRTEGVIGPGNKFVSVLAAFGWPTGPLVDSGHPDYPSDRSMFGFYRYDDNATYAARLRMKELYANGLPSGSWKPVKCWMNFNSYGFGMTWTQYKANPNNIWRSNGDAYVTVHVYDGANKYNSSETVPPYTTVLFHDDIGKPENLPNGGKLKELLEKLFGIGGSAGDELAKNAGPSTPIKYYPGMGYAPDLGGGRPGNVRPKGGAAFPQADAGGDIDGSEVAAAPGYIPPYVQDWESLGGGGKRTGTHPWEKNKKDKGKGKIQASSGGDGSQVASAAFPSDTASDASSSLGVKDGDALAYNPSNTKDPQKDTASDGVDSNEPGLLDKAKEAWNWYVDNKEDVDAAAGQVMNAVDAAMAIASVVGVLIPEAGTSAAGAAGIASLANKFKNAYKAVKAGKTVADGLGSTKTFNGPGKKGSTVKSSDLPSNVNKADGPFTKGDGGILYDKNGNQKTHADGRPAQYNDSTGAAVTKTGTDSGAPKGSAFDNWYNKEYGLSGGGTSKSSGTTKGPTKGGGLSGAGSFDVGATGVKKTGYDALNPNQIGPKAQHTGSKGILSPGGGMVYSAPTVGKTGPSAINPGTGAAKYTKHGSNPFSSKSKGGGTEGGVIGSIVHKGNKSIGAIEPQSTQTPAQFNKASKIFNDIMQGKYQNSPTAQKIFQKGIDAGFVGGSGSISYTSIPKQKSLPNVGKTMGSFSKFASKYTPTHGHLGTFGSINFESYLIENNSGKEFKIQGDKEDILIMHLLKNPEILKKLPLIIKGLEQEKELSDVYGVMFGFGNESDTVNESNLLTESNLLMEKNYLRDLREKKREKRKVGDKVMKINITGPKDHLTVRAIDLLRQYKVSEKEMQEYAFIISNINQWIRENPKEYAIWKVRYPANDPRLAELNWRLDQQLKASDEYMDSHFPENERLFAKLQNKIQTNINVTDPRNFVDVKPAVTHKQLLKVSKALEESNWKPLDSKVANKTTQTFGLIGDFGLEELGPDGNQVTANFGGLGGVESQPSQFEYKAQEGNPVTVSPPTYKSLSLAGYAKPLPWKMARKKNAKKAEEINTQLDSSESYTKEINADALMKARVEEAGKIYEREMKKWEAKKKSVDAYNDKLADKQEALMDKANKIWDAIHAKYYQGDDWSGKPYYSKTAEEMSKEYLSSGGAEIDAKLEALGKAFKDEPPLPDFPDVYDDNYWNDGLNSETNKVTPSKDPSSLEKLFTSLKAGFWQMTKITQSMLTNKQVHANPTSKQINVFAKNINKTQLSLIPVSQTPIPYSDSNFKEVNGKLVQHHGNSPDYTKNMAWGGEGSEIGDRGSAMLQIVTPKDGEPYILYTDHAYINTNNPDDATAFQDFGAEVVQAVSKSKPTGGMDGVYGDVKTEFSIPVSSLTKAQQEAVFLNHNFRKKKNIDESLFKKLGKKR